MIYPVSEQISQFFSEITDIETGEILLSDEEIEKRLAEINMTFEDKIMELRNIYINSLASAEALKREKLNLEKRQKVEERSAERTKGFMAYLLQGEPFQNGICKIGWRKSEELVCDEDFVEWAKEYADDYLKYYEPVPMKKDILSAMKSGVHFEHVTIQKKNNIQVK